jgi:hypothetical protein
MPTVEQIYRCALQYRRTGEAGPTRSLAARDEANNDNGNLRSTSVMKPAKKPKTKANPNFRVRNEAPTVAEAIYAAQGLTDNIKDQIEIAAVLTGLPEDEVSRLVPQLAPAQKAGPGATLKAPQQIMMTNRTGAPRSVVVERKAPRRTY